MGDDKNQLFLAVAAAMETCPDHPHDPCTRTITAVMKLVQEKDEEIARVKGMVETLYALMLDDQTTCKRFMDPEGDDDEECGEMVTRCTPDEEFLCEAHGQRDSELTITPLIKWARGL